jgi:diacylglycerol kinase family enzyme
MPGIGVVLNPYSKTYKNDPRRLDHMAFIIGDKASCKPTDDIDDLYRVADEFKSRGIDILAISGGDGTIHCTLTAFLKVYGEKPLPKVTFLRGGTLNTIASTLGIYGTTETLMSNLLLSYHEDRPFTEKKLRLMKINDAYGCIFGNGVIANFMDAYYENAALNPFVAAKTLVKSVYSACTNGKFARGLFKRFDAEVTVDGQTWPFGNYCAVFAASIRQFGLEFNVFHEMMRQNERFHAYGISLPPRTIVPYLKKLHDGKSTGCEHFIDAPALDMRIKLEKPMRYTIDGDMLDGTDEIRVSQGPEITVVS